MDIRDAKRRCEEEIADLHRFFVDWFRGEVPQSDAAWARVTSALDGDFQLVTPDGEALPREILLEGIRARYGQHGPTSDFTIWTQRVEVRYADATFVLATYQEWQRCDGEERGRQSTALFAPDPQAPHGLRWRHVHETWLPVATETR